MPHIHGIAWLNTTSESVKKFKCFNEDKSFDLEHEDLPKLINEWTSCSLSHDSEKLNTLVEKVNIHEHRDSCLKRGDGCRFDFPKLPSPETMVAVPYCFEALDEDKELAERVTKFKDIKKKVKEKLTEEFVNDIGYNYTLEMLLDELNIPMKDYIDAIKMSERGVTVILKRDVCEAYVNNFKPSFMYAWQANMDIQICCDIYAVVSYCTEYFTKTDSGETEKLKEALAAAKLMSDSERMFYLAHIYFTSREVCESESVYRLLADLHLTSSDLKCIFVSGNLPESRSNFLIKVDETEENGEALDEEDENEHTANNIDCELLKVEGREGTFKKASAIHDKYSLRPAILNDICLAQFATSYQPSSKPRKPEDEISEADSVSVSKSTLLRFDKISNNKNEEYSDECYLPKFIQLENGSYMKTRKTPSVLRLHKKKKGHEKTYSELVLFFPWINEDFLYPEDEEKCASLHKSNFTLIQGNHHKMLPFAEKLTEIQELMQNLKDENKGKEYGDVLDPELEQDNAECEEELEEIDLSELPLEGEEKKSKYEKTKFKPITQKDWNQAKSDARLLSLEQRIAFDEILEVCKKRLFSKSKFDVNNPPKRIIAQGKLIYFSIFFEKH